MNKVFTPYTVLLFKLSVILLLTTSCEGLLGRYDDKECDYNVRIFYHYNRENMSRDNVLPTYVKWMTEYIFDANEVLLMINPLLVDECDGTYFSELNLPPGRYSIITVGNGTSMSEITDKSSESAPQIGVTHREDMLLSLMHETQTLLTNETESRADRGYFDNCGRLYHGYRTFTIAPAELSHIRVDMVHSHCVINYTIRWKNIPSTPTNTKDFHVRLDDIPSRYALMPQYYYPNGVASEHDPATSDPYNFVCLGVIHHIPTVYKPGMLPDEQCNIVNHRAEATMLGRRVTGKTITYRLRNDGDVKFSLHGGGGTRAGETQIMKDLPINRILQDLGEDLDLSLRQEYDLIFEINDDGTVKTFFAGVADWDEGEGLGQ